MENSKRKLHRKIAEAHEKAPLITPSQLLDGLAEQCAKTRMSQSQYCNSKGLHQPYLQKYKGGEMPMSVVVFLHFLRIAGYKIVKS